MLLAVPGPAVRPALYVPLQLALEPAPLRLDPGGPAPCLHAQHEAHRVHVELGAILLALAPRASTLPRGADECGHDILHGCDTIRSVFVGFGSSMPVALLAVIP